MKGIRPTAESELPTHWGRFRLLHFAHGDEEGVAVVRGAPSGEGVLCRVHSECLTGEVFGSLRCDCRPQLELALEKISRENSGVLVYLRQEGRGIGLGNKIRAYSLQDRGRDTVEANVELGFAPDERSYELAVRILKSLGVISVDLMTNNPLKVDGLKSGGIRVRKQLTHWAGTTRHSDNYVRTKRHRMGHLGDPEEGDEVGEPVVLGEQKQAGGQ